MKTLYEQVINQHPYQLSAACGLAGIENDALLRTDLKRLPPFENKYTISDLALAVLKYRPAWTANKDVKPED